MLTFDQPKPWEHRNNTYRDASSVTVVSDDCEMFGIDNTTIIDGGENAPN